MSKRLTRPRVLTSEVQEGILESLAAGNFISTACAAAGICDDTFYHWRRRLEKGDPEAQRYEAFFTKSKKAIAEGETRLVREVQEGAPNWHAKAWCLARRFYQRWGHKRHLVVERRPTDAQLEAMSDEQLADLRAGRKRLA